RHWPAALVAYDRQGETEVGGRLRDPDATRHADEDVGAAEAGLETFFDHGQDHVQPVEVDAVGNPPNHRVLCLVDQALDLDQERPGAFHGGDDHSPRSSRRGAGEDGGRRVWHLLEPGFTHGEDADLLGRAEPVLGRAQDPELLPAVPFQVQHGVNDMLQDPGSGDRTLFGHVTDQKDRHPGLLRQPHEAGGRLAYLGHAAGAAAAAEDAIELTPAQWHARRIFRADLAERQRAGRLMGSGSRVSGCLPDLELLQRVPGPAMWTLAGPANALAPAFGAHKGDGRFGHRQTVYP